MSKVNKTQDEEARQILALLLSPSVNEESKLAIIKGLLNNSKNEGYTLGKIRQLLTNSNFDNNDTNRRCVAGSSLYGLFFDDNSFMIAIEKSFTKDTFFRGPREMKVTALYDVFTTAQLGDSVEELSRLSRIEAFCPWRSEESIEINGMRAYPVLISKIVPSKLFEEDIISVSRLKVICDVVNNYLDDNPLFTKEVFAKKRKQ